MTEHPIRYVRRNVFKATQQELADLGGVSRSRISRYESAGEDPPYTFLQRLRKAAMDLGLPWDSDWLFAPPAPEPDVPVHVRVREDVQ